jgi:isopentenyl phosphate kinase
MTDLAIEPIQHALDAGLVPLVYGDVAIDEIWGGTIISTEEILVYLAHTLTPASILIAGDYEGVLDANDQVISLITPPTLDDVQVALGGSAQVDVTGGMASKVTEMLTLCESLPELKVHIFSGRKEGNVFRALTEDAVSFGTRISA